MLKPMGPNNAASEIHAGSLNFAPDLSETAQSPATSLYLQWVLSRGPQQLKEKKKNHFVKPKVVTHGFYRVFCYLLVFTRLINISKRHLSYLKTESIESI